MNKSALNEINKGCKMAMESIDLILKKDLGENKEFVDELNHEYNEYEKISTKVQNLFDAYSSDEPQETNMVDKMMLWSGIEMKTIMDESISKLADIMMNGVNMGIIEGIKIKNNKKLDKMVIDIIDEYIEMQQNNYNNLKSYL